MLEEHLAYVADCARDANKGLLCLQAGAAKVFGIDSTAMIEVARETLGGAGLVGHASLSAVLNPQSFWERPPSWVT